MLDAIGQQYGIAPSELLAMPAVDLAVCYSVMRRAQAVKPDGDFPAR